MELETKSRQYIQTILGAFALLFLLCSCGMAPNKNDRKGTNADRHDKLVETLFASHKSGDVDAVLRLYADNAVVEWTSGKLACRNKAAFTGVLKERMNAEALTVTDRDVTINHRINSDDWIVVEGEWKGSVKGEPVALRFVSMLQIKDGLIVHQIDYSDSTPLQRLKAE